MSFKHPIISVTGSSGAGTSTARIAFEHIFRRIGAQAVYVEGDAFHKHDREAMKNALQRARIRSENLSHFGPSANHLDRLENLFRSYAADGTGMARRYLHTENEAAPFGQEPGTFTPWEPIPEDTDVMMYEGLHGGIVSDRVNIAEHVDLLGGVGPTINLEWIPKICRDINERGYSTEEVKKTILRRMPDYVNYITPQFSLTDVNFQRVPLVDTSNPFIARDVPNSDESMVVIRFRDPRKWHIDFPYLLTMLNGAYMSRPNTLVVPGSRMRFAIEIIIGPMVETLIERRRMILEEEQE